ncbi:MAG: acetyl-CoA C-acyltransferase, partial [SAR324 cluster bacterium]|nr:acetyl-CoA C-acyltransferase [SAR324 cluster bacterium]
MGEAWIIDAVRTPRGKGKKDVGSLAETHPQELMATTLRALTRRNPIDSKDVDDVIVGCVSQAGEQGACIARNSVLLAQWPQEVTGVTLNRFCGSGLQGVNFAVMGVMSGQQDLAVGGGVESMSRQPMGSDGGGLDGHNADLLELYPMVPQGISADLIATLEGFTREQLDTFAASSQDKAAAAQEAGRFGKSLVPVKDQEGNVVLERDEYPRAGTTVETLGGLKPAFEELGAYAPHDSETFDEMTLRVYPHAGKIDHVHHAGNSSGIVDGAGAVLVASPEYARAHGLKPRARVISVATVGAEPVIMLTAPTPASRKAMTKAGMSVEDVDLWEINEAFAVVPLKT